MKPWKTIASAIGLSLSLATHVAFAQETGPAGSGQSVPSATEMSPLMEMSRKMMAMLPELMKMLKDMEASLSTYGMEPYNALNLSEQQRIQVARIQEQDRKQQSEMMRKMRDESARMENMLAADRPDPAAVGRQQMKVDDIKRQMLMSRIEARNRIYDLLTSEQRQQLRQYGSGWITGSEPSMASPALQQPLK